MFTFNRNEQLILLLLCGTLLVGIVVSYLDKKNPENIPDFEVRKNAVPVPSPEAIAPQANKPLRIDLNQATIKELQRLPGIGPQIAGRIIAHREKNGNFSSIEEITKVSGIGPKTLDRLRPHLTMSTP